ncbi:MAG: 1,4-alpha-glucan branching protein domain-containing protein [Promethearchaeota archaeon]
MPEKIGYFTLVLHSHLPWVLNHGIWPHGTNWVYEAAAETYIPLLDELNKLIVDGFQPKLTIGLTPVLCEMLRHSSFKTGFLDYINEKINAAEHDRIDFENNKYEEGRIRLSIWWSEFYNRIKDSFLNKYNSDIVGAFKKLQDKGLLDIITCSATHGYSPLLSRDSSINAQFEIAVKNYQKHFGRKPTGAWLPECAYRPSYRWKNPLKPEEEFDRVGIEYFLAEHDIKYFFIDTALLIGGKSQGVYAARFPLLKELWKQFASQYKEHPVSFEKSPYEVYLVATNCAKKPVAFFTRDPKTGILVWSGEHGYPGCAEYLDFHKKHFPGGLRYWKVTGPKVDLGDKMLYWPDDVPRKLDENADHFVSVVKEILREFKEKNGFPGIVVAPYDCELFGHWWFEGTWWLNRILKQLESDPEIELTNTRLYLEENPPNKVVQIIEGSWGQGSSHWVWFNDWTIWTWEKIYECEDKNEKLITQYAESADINLTRTLKQLCRELLLLESSDWQFLITTWSARDYAEQRISLHYENYNRLYNMAIKYIKGENLEEGDWAFLGKLEQEDNIFPELNLNAFKIINKNSK